MFSQCVPWLVLMHLPKGYLPMRLFDSETILAMSLPASDAVCQRYYLSKDPRNPVSRHQSTTRPSPSPPHILPPLLPSTHKLLQKMLELPIATLRMRAVWTLKQEQNSLLGLCLTFAVRFMDVESCIDRFLDRGLPRGECDVWVVVRLDILF